MTWRFYILHLIKQNCLLKTFLRTFILMTVTPKMVKKVIMNIDLSKASGPDCIPVVALKNYEPERSYKLVNKCLSDSEEVLFSNCWKVSLVVSECWGKVYS